MASMEKGHPAEHLRKFVYETVTGYFLQDDPDVDADCFDYVRRPLLIFHMLQIPRYSIVPLMKPPIV